MGSIRLYKRTNWQKSIFSDTSMYYSEYSLHMYGWFITSQYHKTNIPILSDIAEDSAQADIEVGERDSRWYVNLGITILELLGL